MYLFKNKYSSLLHNRNLKIYIGERERGRYMYEKKYSMFIFLIHFKVSFAVNQYYSDISLIGEETLENKIRDELPSVIPELQSEDIKDVSFYEAVDGKIIMYIFPHYPSIIPNSQFSVPSLISKFFSISLFTECSSFG